MFDQLPDELKGMIFQHNRPWTHQQITINKNKYNKVMTELVSCDLEWWECGSGETKEEWEERKEWDSCCDDRIQNLMWIIEEREPEEFDWKPTPRPTIYFR